jgi:CheY-like chemotaxis protein
MWNFLSNAVKFTPRDGKIQVHLERVNSHIEISVSDTGRGIPADFLPHVFDRFSQADSSTTRRYGGLGLGLAVVKHIVELHGGRVVARSAGEGQGATFTVHLPIAIVQQDVQGREHPLTPSEQPELPGDINLTGVRILLVDDDIDSCDVLRRVLAECGARTDMAYSADQALQSLQANPVDVIVSDIGMPEMDGYQLIRAVRERGSRTPAVALTAFARPEDRIRALRAGYNMHIAKPIEPRELIEVIASLTRTGATW